MKGEKQMNYQDISKVNGEINMIDLKGKNYAMVPERVTAFRKLFPEGFINTEIVDHDGTTVLMQAKVGYYENGCPIILGTGFAQEVRGRGMVNGTSYIENCETSAVGRALGMIGLGLNGGGICSAEELVNAVTAQRQMKEEEKAFCNPPIPAGGPVETASKLPEKKSEPNPVEAFLKTAMKGMRENRGISIAENNRLFKEQLGELIRSKLAPDKPMSEYTMAEAEALIEAMYKNFPPEGSEVKVG